MNELTKKVCSEPCPSLEALRLLVSRTTSKGRRLDRGPHKTLFIDISKAYVPADVEDHDVSVEQPKEMKVRGKKEFVCVVLRRRLRYQR